MSGAGQNTQQSAACVVTTNLQQTFPESTHNCRCRTQLPLAYVSCTSSTSCYCCADRFHRVHQNTENKSSTAASKKKKTSCVRLFVVLSRIFQQSQPPCSSCTAGSQSFKYISQTASVQIANDRGQTALSTRETALSLLLLANKHGRCGEKNELLLFLAFSFPFEQTRTSSHFTPMLGRQVGILCCTARGLSYLYITGGARVRFVSRKRACWRHAFDS